MQDSDSAIQTVEERPQLNDEDPAFHPSVLTLDDTDQPMVAYKDEGPWYTRLWLTRKWQWGVLFLILGMTVVAMVLNATVIQRDDIRDDTNSGETESMKYYRERYTVLRTTLGSLSKPYLFYISNTPQYQAMQWLVFQDKTLPDYKSVDFSFRLTQRYAYFVLFLATGGDDWVSISEEEILMEDLVKDTHECEGFLGVECNVQGEITSLNLRRQNLVGSLPAEIGLLTSLQNLELWENSLVGSLPGGIGKLTNLEVMDISFNELAGEIPQAVGESLTKLRSLRLSSNFFSGTVPTTFASLTNMEVFDISQISNLGGRVFEEGVLESWDNLLLLDVSSTALSGSIPESFGELTKLSYLKIDATNLIGGLPDTFGNLSDLRILSFGGNEGRFETSITPVLEKLTNLERFQAHGSGIFGSMPPDAIGRLSNLEFFALTQSKVSGTIPSEFGKLSNLKYFFIEAWDISGPFPREIGDLPLLQDLAFTKTNVNGTIPDNICEKQKSGALNLGAIPVSAECPCCLAPNNSSKVFGN